MPVGLRNILQQKNIVISLPRPPSHFMHKYIFVVGGYRWKSVVSGETQSCQDPHELTLLEGCSSSKGSCWCLLLYCTTRWSFLMVPPFKNKQRICYWLICSTGTPSRFLSTNTLYKLWHFEHYGSVYMEFLLWKLGGGVPV